MTDQIEMRKDEPSAVDHQADSKVLKLFAHQVSGRAHMLKFDSTTICKSLSKREWYFYNRVPLSLRNFTPRLKGLLFVNLVNENCRSQRFIPSNVWLLNGNSFSHEESSKPDESDINGNSTYFSTSVDSHRNHLFDEIPFKGLDRVQYNTTDGFTEHVYTVDKDKEAPTEALGKNPWAVRQHQREIVKTLNGDILRKEVNIEELCRKMGFSNSENLNQNVKAYLLLEDVTSGYKLPSILDLKIGTQLERSGCSQEKKDKHEQLVLNSSTGSVGLRLAGMQVYQDSSKEYLCRDKYYGRGLSAKGFEDMIALFFHNGTRTMIEVIPPIIARLKELRDELEKQVSFRFYASSILITYESFLSGDVAKDVDPRRRKDKNSSLVKEDGFSSDEANGTEKQFKCEVFMIDFAHTTFKGFLNDLKVYEGPDKDCLVAVDNLIAILGRILNESTKKNT